MVDRSTGIFAALIAIAAWFVLGSQVCVTAAAAQSALKAVLLLAGMFTMATNLLVALAMTAVAFKRWPDGPAPNAPVLAGLTVYGAVVGIVYYLLLSWQHHLSGLALVANWGLYYAVPSLLVLFWLFAAPKSGLRLWHPVAWLVCPLIYCIAALAHGASTGRYPYSFIDVAEFGWAGVLTHVAALAGVFVALGMAFVMLARTMSREEGHTAPT